MRLVMLATMAVMGGCVGTNVGALRAGVFEPGAALEIECAAYPNGAADLNARLALKYSQGWRLVSSGQTITVYPLVGLSTVEPVLCLERRVEPAGERSRPVEPPGRPLRSSQNEDDSSLPSRPPAKRAPPPKPLPSEIEAGDDVIRVR